MDHVPLILCVDDQPLTYEMLRPMFKKEGLEIIIASDGKAGLALSREHLPDLVALDIGMPEMDGFEFYKQLQGDPRTARIPVLFVTVRWKVEDLKRGFGLGAQDYVCKPFRWEELAIRIKAILQRNKPTADDHARVVLNRQTRQCQVRGRRQPIELTENECLVLAYLMDHPFETVSAKTLMSRSLDYPLDQCQYTDAVRRLIRQLREKLEPDPAGKPCLIRNVPRSGYMWCPSGKPAPEKTA